MTGEGSNRARLIGDLLGQSAARFPDKLAVIAGNHQRTYRELDVAANRMANAMITAGLTGGARTAILSSNRSDYPVVYFGAARAGCVLAHLSIRSTPQDVADMLKRLDARAVFVGAESVSLLDRALAALGRKIDSVVLEPSSDHEGVGFQEFMDKAADTPPDATIAEEAPYSITFTGGTTGRPKAVVATHRGRVWSAHIAADGFDLTSDDVMVCTTPLFHVAGLTSWFQTGITLGCTLRFLPHWDVDDFASAIDSGCTAAFMVPTQMVALLAREDLVGRLDNLRYVNFGGSPLSPTVLARAMELYPNVAWEEHYGQSEAGPIAVLPAEFNTSHAASVGRSLPGQELAALADDGTPLPPGEIGEIGNRGPNVFLEYLDDPEQTAAAKTADGWLRTGDVGYVDADGFLYLVDRAKDMMICGGENVYPAEIENALYKHPAVRECAVFGIPDDKWGEVPAAYVVRRDGQDTSEAELIEFCAAHVARHKRPRVVRFTDEFPKTAIGKIQKNVLRDPWWEGRERAI